MIDKYWDPGYKQRFWLVLVLLLGMGCEGQKRFYKSPPGYNLNKPERFPMQSVLHEISGIAFNKGNSDTIYAEQDEEGKLFHFKLGDKQLIASKFAKKGDFEDVTICRGMVIMLRSDGVLFSFPLAEANQEKVGSREWDGLLPAGEFEGLASVEATGQLIVLCKHCGDEKTSNTNSGYLFALEGSGNIKATGGFEINVRDIGELAGEGKLRFHPSGLAQNPLTGEWYVLSAVNKLLVVTDAAWKVKAVYPLKPALFNQPEGIAFGANGDLYISNERGETEAGTVLKFARH